MKLHPYGMIYTVLYIILCKLFLETFAKKRSVSIFYTTMLLGVLSVLEYVCSVVLADFLVLKAILIIVMGTFVMMYVFGEKFWRILILMLLYQGLCFVTDCISWTFLNCVFASAGQEYLRSTNLQMFMAILSQILLFCILLIIKKCFIKQNTAILTGMQWIRITIFPIFTIITIISILIYFNMSSSEEQKNVLLCIAFGMLIMNILVFYLIGDILEGEEKLRKEVLFHKRVKSEIDMYHQIYSKSKFEVKEAVKNGDDFNVEVVISPIDVIVNSEDAISAAVDEFIANANADDYADEQAVNDALAKLVVDTINGNMANLGYQTEKSIIVKVEKDAQGYYGISDDAISALDQDMIAY